MPEHDLPTGVRLPGDDLVEPVVVKEMPGNSHTRQWNSCLIPNAQLRLHLIVPLVTEFWSFARHLNAGYACAVICASLSRCQLHQTLPSLADDHLGQNLPAGINWPDDGEHASPIGRRYQRSERFGEAIGAVGDLSVSDNGCGDVTCFIDRTDSVCDAPIPK